MDSIHLHEISVAYQFNSGVSNQLMNFRARQHLQLALALRQKPWRRLIKILIKIARMTHHLMPTEGQSINDIQKNVEVKKTFFRDSKKPMGSRHCIGQAKFPGESCTSRKYVLL